MNNLIKAVKRKVIRLFLITRQYLIILRQFRALQNQPNKRFRAIWKDRWLHLRDATAMTAFDRHYIFHTAWAARALARIRPSHHVDVGSSLYFVTSVSAFIPITFIDFRPAMLDLSSLSSLEGTLMKLPFDNDSVESISCMHVIEHIGLGRYGEPFDYDGDVKAIGELRRVLQPSGHFLFVVPIGGESYIQFNAHRIYSYEAVLELFADLILEEFVLISDDESEVGLNYSPTLELLSRQKYGCGCFLFRKPD